MAFRDMKMKVLLLMPEMIQDHKDWEGAKVAVLNNCAEYEPYLRAASLDGALVRFASADIMYNVNYTRRDLRQSLLKAFLEASEE
jgi:hypothetical protein